MRHSIFVAIPAMNESEFLPKTLDSLASQITNFNFEVFVCVNQPESYWLDSARKHICIDNLKTLQFLRNYEKLTLHIIDKSSQGCGWDNKKFGVGYARKTLIDTILQKSNPNDIIVSFDADTIVKSDYLQTIFNNFNTNSEVNAIAVPYYHLIDGYEEKIAKSILRYEIYMRNFLVNLLKINSPYAFTALGSAIAMKAKAVSKIGGITPHQSGEDFYLLQKFAKMGGLSIFNKECVYPSPRSSDRVPFGTGPAVTMGVSGIGESYPIYHYSSFIPIGEAYENMILLYNKQIEDESNKFLHFLRLQNRGNEIWTAIRDNVSDYQHFIKAFHQKADGLRILQFVRSQHKTNLISDEQALGENLRFWFSKNIIKDSFSFEKSSIVELDEVRNFLFVEEMKMRKQSR